MAARRGKSQARRNSGGDTGLPGWAWMVLGIVLTVVVVMAAPRLLKSSGGDGFFRPKPNPDAQPAAAEADDDAVVPDDAAPAAPAAAAARTKETRYDFYTLLPGDEVAMSDAELAAREREEAAAAKAPATTAATTAAAVADAPDDGASAPAPVAEDAAAKPAAPVATASAAPRNDTPYVLQAGAFGASGDAEAVKARIALLGLGARVESAQIGGKTVYRVRMGPYATASELAEAKRKLASGGLPAMAIQAR